MILRNTGKIDMPRYKYHFQDQGFENFIALAPEYFVFYSGEKKIDFNFFLKVMSNGKLKQHPDQKED